MPGPAQRHHSPEGAITPQPYPIVGIGASAGGLDAIRAVLDAVPAQSGLAFILVQHQDPAGESHLAELLSAHSAIHVAPAEDGLAIEPDHVYVSVPSRDIVVEDGHLRLLKQPKERRLRRPIDRLFESLAAAHGDRAVAVILSGTAADGSHGLRAIKGRGGLVIAQEPATAAYDGMPRSAIATGLVDLVLPPERIATVLLRFAKDVPPLELELELELEGEGEGEGEGSHDEDARRDGPAPLGHLIDVLQRRFEYDLSGYKRPTLLRRTQRRMALLNLDEFDTYAARVREDPDEAAHLFRDLMINVSSFFRDAEAWQELERRIIDPLIQSRQNGDEIRVWVPACATGEEAYSIGMLLVERIEASGKQLTPRIFATDVTDSLQTARAGIYPEAIAGDLSPGRLERFFVKDQATYRVTNALRELVVFALHNVMDDPPFSRMDIVSCRNFLIYVEPDAQAKVLRLFNFALREGGALLLGSAETIGTQSKLFETVSAKWRIFRSCAIPPGTRFDFPRPSLTTNRRGVSDARSVPSPEEDYLSSARRALLDRFVPPSVVIDRHHHVLHYFGTSAPYLQQTGGEPTRDVLVLVRADLRAPLRRAVNEAIDTRRTATSASAPAASDDGQQSVTITVDPIGPSDGDAPKFLVTFEKTAQPRLTELAPPQAESEQPGEQLERELRLTRDELRRISEQYDRLLEEYGTASEEMLSINEELQSSNEELETSKEEMQSLNEELQTINGELREKIEIVQLTNDDLNNLLASTEVATLFLDIRCRIRWFTPTAAQLFRILDSDVGRRISDLAPAVTGSSLDAEARHVLERLAPLETEVSSDQGRHFIRRVLPYRTADNRIDGVVVTLVDITERKQIEQTRERLMHESSHRVKNTLATVHAMVRGIARRSGNVAEFLSDFEPRLAALGRAHQLLLLPAEGGIELGDLLYRELDPYVGLTEHRVTAEGDALLLGRDAAIALELVFHELVTNATKHGALSTDAGSIAVRWRPARHGEEEGVRIEWIESGGPPMGPTVRHGFGCSLISSTVSHDLGGRVTLDFRSQGLHCCIEFPVHRREAGTNAKQQAVAGRAVVDG
jgi:two-component system, chemotaxis family, CheB/CheR fusion protein